MKTGLGHHVNSSLEEPLHIDQQGAKRQTGPLGRKRHQQVDIALIPGILSGHGPEYPYVPDAVTFGQSKNLHAVSFDQRMHLLASLSQRGTPAGRPRPLPAIPIPPSSVAVSHRNNGSSAPGMMVDIGRL